MNKMEGIVEWYDVLFLTGAAAGLYFMRHGIPTNLLSFMTYMVLTVFVMGLPTLFFLSIISVELREWRKKRKEV